MPTLYVENVPGELYEALRERARRNRRSISAEVLSLLEQGVPTEAEIARRKDLFELARKIRSGRPPAARRPFPSAEQVLREDRRR